MSEWIWERTPDGASRFVLGTVGERPLVCIGTNPSTAVPGDLDPTATRVSSHAAGKGHDSWVMFNVYPQISTDPTGLHLEFDPELKELNERHIAEQVDGRSLTILAAWGTLIEKRHYLRPLALDIATLPGLSNCTWMSLGPLTKAGHPRHPLYARGDTPFVPFDVVGYSAARSGEVPRARRSVGMKSRLPTTAVSEGPGGR